MTADSCNRPESNWFRLKPVRDFYSVIKKKNEFIDLLETFKTERVFILLAAI